MSESPEVTQPPEMLLLDRLRELDRRIAASVERVVYKLHHELGERIRSSNQDLLRLVEELKPEIPSTFLASDDLAPITTQAGTSAGRRAVHELLEAVGRIDAASTQADVLAELLEQARRFASRSAFFLTRGGVARGWASRGFGSDVAIESVEVEPEGLAAFQDLQRGHGPIVLRAGDRTALGRWLEAPAGSEAVMIPFILRGRLGGALYADRLERDGALDVESLQLLTHNAAQALETLAVRAAGTSPALCIAGSAAGGAESLQTWEPAAAAAGAVTPTAAWAAPEPAPSETAGAAVAEPAEEPATLPASYQPESVYEPAAFEPPTYEPAAFEPPAYEPAAFEAAAVEEPVTEKAPSVYAEPELARGFVAEELPEAELEAAPEELFAEEPTVDAGVELFEPVAEPDLGIAEPDLEEYGVLSELPTKEVVAEADLWPAEEEEMPAIDYAPTAAEVPPIEPAPIDLDDTSAILEPEISYPDFPVGQQTIRLDISAFQTPSPRVAGIGPEDPTMYRTSAAVPTWEVEEPVAQVEPADYELEASPYEPITEAVATTAPAIASEDPTILGSRASLGITPVPAAPTPPPVAPPPTASPSSAIEPEGEPAGSTQVQPPADIRGPGLAFAAGGGVSGHEALHEEARRLARLLVSEIKLYNEEIIEEGKREGNIYDRLREDIDRSRQMYEERIDPRIRGGEDYFYQELVQRLAGGDYRLLGM